MRSSVVGVAIALAITASCSDGTQESWIGVLATPPERDEAPDPPPRRHEAEQPPVDEVVDRCAQPLGCHAEPALTGVFDARLIPQASGLGASRRNPGVLYVLDDRAGTSSVWAIRPNGDIVASLEISGLNALDGESLAVARCQPDERATCLYIGDIGDNLRTRSDVRILRAGEPDLSSAPPANPLPADEIVLTYPAGPHDAEALLVGDDGVPLIVTKAPHDRETGQTGPTLVFSAPGFASGVLDDLGTVTLPPPRRAVASLFFGNVVTGGDAVAGRVLLRTYDHVVEFVAPGPDSELDSFARWPRHEVASSWQPQSEAIAYDAEGCGLYSVSEMIGDIWFTDCLR